MQIKLKNTEIQEYVNAPASEFPKYTTQLMNVANQNSQATRPRHIGQLSDLIQEFPGQTFEEWVTWYQEQYPDAIDEATDRLGCVYISSALNENSRKIDETEIPNR